MHKTSTHNQARLVRFLPLGASMSDCWFAVAWEFMKSFVLN
jgi:hypothetical protein